MTSTPPSSPSSTFEQTVALLNEGNHEQAYATISQNGGFSQNPDDQHVAGICLYEQASAEITERHLQNAHKKLLKACEHFQAAVDLIDARNQKPPGPNPIYIRDLGICKFAIVEMEFDLSERTAEDTKQRVTACREIKDTLFRRVTKLRGHNAPLTRAFFAAVQFIAGQKNKAIMAFPDIFAQAVRAQKDNPSSENGKILALITQIGQRYDLPTTRSLR